MYAQFDVALMLQYLKNKGYAQEELAAMSDERISKLYHDTARDFILRAQDVLETSEEHENLRKKSTMIMPETIALIGQDISKIYEEIDNYIDLYSVRELANVLLSALPGVKLAKVEKMVRIKIRELQEIWLLELKDNLRSLPEEECDTLMEYYLAHKDDLPMLRDIYQKSKDQAYIDEIGDIAHIKLSMIQEYMPDELESNYKSFYDHSPEKLSIIQKILALTAAYSKGTLLSMSIKELQETLQELEEKEREEAEQKALADRYFERFRAALHDPDDEHFTNVCLDAASELPRQRFQELATELSKQYKHFHQRFSDVSKEYKDMQNLQIVF